VTHVLLKAESGRHLFQDFPHSRSGWGGHLRSPSYYVGTAALVSATHPALYERAEQVTKGAKAWMRTACIRLNMTPEQAAILSALRTAYAEACNSARTALCKPRRCVWNRVRLASDLVTEPCDSKNLAGRDRWRGNAILLGV